MWAYKETHSLGRVHVVRVCDRFLVFVQTVTVELGMGPGERDLGRFCL